MYTTIGTGGVGGDHPYLTGRSIPASIGEINGPGLSFIDTVVNLLNYFDTIGDNVQVYTDTVAYCAIKPIERPSGQSIRFIFTVVSDAPPVSLCGFTKYGIKVDSLTNVVAGTTDTLTLNFARNVVITTKQSNRWP